MPIVLDRFLGLTILSLSQAGLRRAPRDLCRLSRLCDLDLSFNHITDIPDDWCAEGAFPMLRHFNMAHNLVSIVPEDWHHSYLTSLYLEDNEIDRIPKRWNFPKLERFDLSRNWIMEIGHGTFDQSRYARLLELELAHNRLESVTGIADLPKLWYLHLEANQLNYVPSHWVNTLPQLYSLRLRGNLLMKLPGKWRDFKLLCQLDVSHNRLTSLDIPNAMHRLDVFDYDNNPLENVH